MLIGIAFSVGLTVSSVMAQNQTTTYAPIVVSTDALITSITGIVIAIGSVITMLVKSGLLDKKVGTVAVMASDAAVAIKDNRQTIKDLAQNTYEVAKATSPEAAAAADRQIAPVIDRATTRINEYIPKVTKFAELGNKLSNGGKTADPKIAEMADEIPDKIVPS
jgi:hypothetical protein